MRTWKLRSSLLRASLLAGLFALVACHSQTVRLTEQDHARLRSLPVIHVLHYETPPPALKFFSKDPSVRANDIRRAAGNEPAAPLAAGFSRLVEKTEKIQNLKVASQSLPRPVASSARALPARFHDGFVLELWIDQWSLEAISGMPDKYSLTLVGRARLADPAANRMLWTSGMCRVGGVQNRGYRIGAKDLAQPARIGKLLNAARNDCARALLRDFNTRPDRRS